MTDKSDVQKYLDSIRTALRGLDAAGETIARGRGEWRQRILDILAHPDNPGAAADLTSKQATAIATAAFMASESADGEAGS